MTAALDLDWRARSNCANHPDPDIFTTPTCYAEAQLVCIGCPVARQCLKERKGAAGVWGGNIYQGDTDKQPAYTRYLPAPHGIDAARKRHQRKGQPLCARCQEG